MAPGNETEASDSSLDVIRATFFFYGVQYIGPVSLVLLVAVLGDPHIDLIRAPYVLYGGKYIDRVPLALCNLFRPLRTIFAATGSLTAGRAGTSHSGATMRAHACVGCLAVQITRRAKTCPVGARASRSTSGARQKRTVWRMAKCWVGARATAAGVNGTPHTI